MKAEDLRIGNLVYPDMSYPEPVTVCAKDFEDTTYLKPIPLTEEWLLKFGFVEHPLDWYRLKDFSICLKENGRCTVCCSGGIFHIYAYIHQLQNLHHALTGEELTIKDND